MELTLYHFFPDKLNLYGDRGNIITLQKRAEWRGISLRVVPVTNVNEVSLKDADILFIGGGSDREQALCTEQLFSIKDEFKTCIEEGVPTLTICGGYQFLGDYYETIEGQKLKGLGILDLHTIGKEKRLMSNIVIRSEMFGTVVGFENHGGRTYHKYPTIGDVLKGYGNNDDDAKEGIHYKNLLGTYMHGPLLPKNPKIADYLLKSALERKYSGVTFPELNDKMENKANQKACSLA